MRRSLVCGIFLSFLFVHSSTIIHRLNAQQTLDSLTLFDKNSTAFSYHLYGRQLDLFEHYIRVIDFRNGSIKVDSIAHGFTMRTGLADDKSGGLSSTFCHNLNIQRLGEQFPITFENYILPSGPYQMNWMALEDGKIGLKSFRSTYGKTSQVFIWNDHFVYFDGGSRNNIIIENPVSKKIIYQTPANKLITSSTTNNLFDVFGDYAGYVVKEANTSNPLFCLLNLQNQKTEYKRIEFPDFIKGGSFNKLMVRGDLFYLTYTGSSIPYYEKEAMAQNKTYLLEVNFQTGKYRYVILSDIFKRIGDNYNIVARINKESNCIYIFQSRRDIDPEYKGLPFIQELIKVDLAEMSAKKIFEYHSVFSETIHPYGDYYLVISPKGIRSDSGQVVYLNKF